MSQNSFGTESTLSVGGIDYRYFRLATLEEKGLAQISRLPVSHRILLENLLRQEDGRKVKASDIEKVMSGDTGANEISFMPARVLLQDFTGVPCVVDLAAMRDALAAMGCRPVEGQSLMPADLVIDHSYRWTSMARRRRSISMRRWNSRETASAICCSVAQTAFTNFARFRRIPASFTR